METRSPYFANQLCSDRTKNMSTSKITNQDTSATLIMQPDHHQAGFIECVQSANNSSTVHFILHHAVEKDSPTTPIHIVFDCSCRQSPSYPCLNDCLIAGLPPVNDLCAILV